MPPYGSQPPAAPPSRFRELWPRIRRGFRWFRILALLAVLAVAGFLFYWHQTGLPDFVKESLLSALRHRGLDLQFQSLHFRWDRGLVARRVTFGRDQLLAGPQLNAEEVQIVPDAAAALRGQLQINLLRLREAQILWRFGGSLPPTPPLQITRLQAELAFDNDLWELRQLDGEFVGASFRIHGIISNALAFSRQWAEVQSPATSGPSASARAHLWMREFAHALTNYQWTGQCNAELDFQLDALHWENARLELKVNAENTHTPWGHGGQVKARLRRQPAPRAPAQALTEIEIAAQTFSNRWLKLGEAKLSLQLPMATHTWWQTNLLATLQARQVMADYFQAEQVQATLDIAPSHTNFHWLSSSFHSLWATSGPVQLRVASPRDPSSTPTRWELDLKANALEVSTAGHSRQVQLSAQVGLLHAWPPFPQTLLGQARLEDWQTANVATGSLALVKWNASLATNVLTAWTNVHLPLWRRAAPICLDWHLTLATSRLDRIHVPFLENQGSWISPRLTVSNLYARLTSGPVSLSGCFNAESRLLQAQLSSDCDLHEVTAPFLTSWSNTLREIQWDKPPHLELSFSTSLPEWTTPPTNLWNTLLPATDGRFKVQAEAGNFRELRLDNWAVEAAWNGHRLFVPRLEINSGTLNLQASGTLDLQGNFSSDLQWNGLPDSLRPVLPPKVLHTLSLWKWQAPPHLRLQLTGNWSEPATWQATGEIRTAQFTFRDVAIEALQTRFDYASNVLTFHEPRVQRPEGECLARRVEADFNSQMVFLSEARGTVDPMAVAQAIGPHVVKTLSPYRFGNPVKAEVSGDIPLHGELGARVDFHLAGSPFEWWRFHASNVTASVLWRDESVTISNLWADFYGGRLRGDIYLDFSSPQDTEMQLRFSLSQVQFAGLMADISERTNRVEGLLSGHLNAQARAQDWKSWNGFGNASLTDGLIWEIPIFGLFSPVLNAISPGLGNSRAREAHATFNIRDSVIRTDDLVIQSAGYNLKYRGTVNFDYEVDARVEAELLRETKMFGPVLSLFFKPFTKLFEYRVTGTLAQPKTKPVYIPGFLMKLLTPIRSLRELLQPDSDTPSTVPPGNPTQKP